MKNNKLAVDEQKSIIQFLAPVSLHYWMSFGLHWLYLVAIIENRQCSLYGVKMYVLRNNCVALWTCILVKLNKLKSCTCNKLIKCFFETVLALRRPSLSWHG